MGKRNTHLKIEALGTLICNPLYFVTVADVYVRTQVMVIRPSRHDCVFPLLAGWGSFCQKEQHAPLAGGTLRRSAL